VAEAADDAVYLAMALKNSGNGMALLDRWYIHADRELVRGREIAEPASFRRLTRDLYIPANEFGFWQGAIRDSSDPNWHEVRRAIADRRPMMVDLLYSDIEGGQRIVSRFGMTPRHEGDGWITTVNRHWYLDQASPR
jgi:hypothetical protein